MYGRVTHWRVDQKAEADNPIVGYVISMEHCPRMTDEWFALELSGAEQWKSGSSSKTWKQLKYSSVSVVVALISIGGLFEPHFLNLLETNLKPDENYKIWYYRQ